MSDIVGVLQRRWVAAILASLVSLGAGIAGFVAAGPTYSFTGSYLLLPPHVSTTAEPGTTDFARGNPLFYLGSLSQARDILIGEMGSKNRTRRLDNAFPEATYEVTPDALSSSPVVVVTAESPVEQQARGLLRATGNSIPGALRELQDALGVKPEARISAQQLNMDAEPSVSHKRQIRMAVAATGLVAIISLLLIALYDNHRGSKLKRVRSARHGSELAPDHRVTPADADRRPVDHETPALGRGHRHDLDNEPSRSGRRV